MTRIFGYIRTVIIVLILFSGLFSLAAGGGGEEFEADSVELRIMTTIAPLGWMAEEIAGDLAEVSIMLPPGGNAHTFEPTPRQMVSLGEADLLLAVGGNLEENFLKVIGEVLPDLRVVELNQNLDLIPFTSGHDEDEHDGTDPHVWLSPKNMILMAETIKQSLISLHPEQDAFFSGTGEMIESDIIKIDREISSILSPYSGRSFIVFHPSFGYFARDYNIRQIAVEKEGAEPRGAELLSLIRTAEEALIHVVYTAPGFPKNAGRAVAEAIGGTTFELDPMPYDWAAGIIETARILAKGFQYE